MSLNSPALPVVYFQPDHSLTKAALRVDDGFDAVMAAGVFFLRDGHDDDAT
jgi:hypothetical protein